MVDVKKLKIKILEKGFSISSLAKKIGMDKTTFYRRLNDNGNSFTIGEIQEIVNVLEISNDEARSIFFIQSVA